MANTQYKLSTNLNTMNKSSKCYKVPIRNRFKRKSAYAIRKGSLRDERNDLRAR